MIERLAIKPIYLAFLLIDLYFIIFTCSPISVGLGIILSIALVRQYRLKVILKIVAILSLFTIYFCFLNWQQKQAIKNVPKDLTAVKLIPDTISVDGDLLSARAIARNQKFQLYYRLQSKEEQKYFKQLMHVVSCQIDSEVTKPVGKRHFQGFDYSHYLKNEGIYAIVRVKRIHQIRELSTKNPIMIIKLWRRKLLVYIDSHFPSPMNHYMTGLLLGYLSKSFNEMSDIYTNLGIIHLFALSGMQVGFFLNFFKKSLLRLGVLREQVSYLLFPFAFVYGGLTGFSISVLRSLIQAILSQFGFKKWDNLGLTIIILLMTLPHFLQTTGGVLSFAYAFILSTIRVENARRLKRLLISSLVLSFGVLPLLIFYFASFQPLSILLTICFSVIFDVFILPLLSLVLLVSPIIKMTIFNSCFIALEGIIKRVHHFSPNPLVFGKPSSTLLIVMLLMMVLIYDFWSRKKWRFTFIVITVLLFSIVKHPLSNEVTILDIGQGDSIFIRDIKGKTIMIDTGGKVDFKKGDRWRNRQITANAETLSIPYLKSRGVSCINQLVLTHTDTDHIGDMEVLAKHFRIKEIVVSQGSLTKEPFMNRLKKMNIKVKIVKTGDKLPIMNSYLQVLYPFRSGDGGNNDSIVLYGKLLNYRFLFTGDLEKEGELDLIRHYPHLPVDVLKAGHHGSKGSSDLTFLKHIKSPVALVSAGLNNRYHHPHLETLDRFERCGMTVYRTDYHGSIRYKGIRKFSVETVK